jgi:hypothetical protein
MPIAWLVGWPLTVPGLSRKTCARRLLKGGEPHVKWSKFIIFRREQERDELLSDNSTQVPNLLIDANRDLRCGVRTNHLEMIIPVPLIEVRRNLQVPNELDSHQKPSYQRRSLMSRKWQGGARKMLRCLLQAVIHISQELLLALDASQDRDWRDIYQRPAIHSKTRQNRDWYCKNNLNHDKIPWPQWRADKITRYPQL